ncbi:hypothetical protein EB001_18195, partial [bacterium]|nr:hypothetical protein [bacterium]
MTGKLKTLFASLFIAGWFLIVGPIIAHADGTQSEQVQSTPSDTPTVTIQPTDTITATISVTPAQI